ncbi:transposase [Amycolatopsis sp. cmx-4-68]|uniref:transposase n=1 Tax=Amycolatopsis sp. cmx-4-68 TaxID=2790938 RepID=UPI00397A76C2
MPGRGPILGAGFLVAADGTLSGFVASGRPASYAGLVPVPPDSGRVSGNLRRPQCCNRRLRRTPLRDGRTFTPTAQQPTSAAA